VSAGLGWVEAVPAFADGRHGFGDPGVEGVKFFGLARVARPTVYLVFGSHAGLFEAVGADLLERGGFGRMLQAAAHPDARSPARGDLWGRGDVRCSSGRAASAVLAQRLADQEALRADVTADQAADLLWPLTSFDSFDLLYTGRDQSIEKTATTLITTADRSLCR
jgi:hypothetical protein